MKYGDKQHKEAWIKYVATKLGFDVLPQELLCKAETMYERGWTAPETIEHIEIYFRFGE